MHMYILMKIESIKPINNIYLILEILGVGRWPQPPSIGATDLHAIKKKFSLKSVRRSIL